MKNSNLDETFVIDKYYLFKKLSISNLQLTFLKYLKQMVFQEELLISVNSN